ncbi:hypothetical protein COUCH_13265 [Couchioplanes caeruleus]|uniref:hypothetical protein n=1 Tax=Couchioplanes caeruleus TaxID=56438 RepID=UPI0020C00F65|nr:hypothetical protein [Couchioplanes caeruleus]UQU67175.1 hypothetical protein COUCH_13265 [Couchioplanes caeruleus]
MPVFRAPTSPAAGTQDPDGYPDGPTERLGPASPPAEPPAVPRRLAVTAVVLAGLALLVAGAATVLAWRALGRAPSPMPAAASSPAGAASYAEEKLKIRAGCTGITFLDLDEPRVNAPGPVSDLRYDSSCGGERPRLALAPGAVAAGDGVDPRTDAAGCAKTIRTSPLGDGQLVSVAKGVVLCVLTSGSLVRVEVAEVTGDGTATLRATSWPAG